MTSLPNRRVRVKSFSKLPLFDWADTSRFRNHHISPLARHVRYRWGYSTETAKAVCEAWGFEGGQADE